MSVASVLEFRPDGDLLSGASWMTPTLTTGCDGGSWLAVFGCLRAASSPGWWSGRMAVRLRWSRSSLAG
jgi:hypothetical protein